MYEPDEEPTHEELEAKRAEILKKFQDFMKAEFPKGEIKVSLENLIPQEAQGNGASNVSETKGEAV